MGTRRFATLLVAIAVIATACGTGGDSDNAPAAAADPTAPEASVSAAENPPDQPPSSDLFSPTEDDSPFDLTGGATDDAEGVTTITDQPRAALGPDVTQATEPWTTDWTRQTIDLADLILGIPRVDPRDLIRPIDTPKFEAIADATWLGEREPGALVQVDGEARFYPLSILSRHEIVNDRFGPVPVAVTFCPLCNTALAFDRRIDGQVIRLGVSGLLRNSDMVMWDEATTSLWQQITGEGIVGAFAGKRLDLISTAIVSYSDVLENFPDALSLSQDTGFGIEYGTNGYTEYSSSSRPFLFNDEPDPRFPALSRVVGVRAGGVDKAYPFGAISDKAVVNDRVGDEPVVVFWGGDTADALDERSIADSAAIGTAIAFDPTVDGQVLMFSSGGDDTFTDAETGSTWSLLGLAVDGPLAGTTLDTLVHRNEFWFAWAAFFPDAEVYSAA
jgi:hypothetical protein